MTLRKPCLTCGALTRAGSRCDLHQKGSATQRGYGQDWQRIRLAVLERDGAVCAYCHGPATTVDHVVPKAHGGSEAFSNLVACCLSCNGRRGSQVRR